MMDDRRSGSTSLFVTKSGASNGAYGLALIGAAIYNLQHATSFWSGVVGFLEALVWPALLLYKLLRFLDR
jgi:hypothetical protein